MVVVLVSAHSHRSSNRHHSSLFIFPSVSQHALGYVSILVLAFTSKHSCVSQSVVYVLCFCVVIFVFTVCVATDLVSGGDDKKVKDVILE